MEKKEREECKRTKKSLTMPEGSAPAGAGVDKANDRAVRKRKGAGGVVVPPVGCGYEGEGQEGGGGTKRRREKSPPKGEDRSRNTGVGNGRKRVIR